MSSMQTMRCLMLMLVCLLEYCSADLLEFFMGPRLGRSVRNVAQPKNSEVSAARILVEKHGYPFEEHEVVSETGHILSLHRIPHGRKRKLIISQKKPVVLFQHGLFAASDSWLFRGPDLDLPYVLADAGYDVWLSNMRGNVYSQKHLNLDPNEDPQFWDFSLHEIALYDYPAIVDYILNNTKQENLYFLGYSIGSTVGFIFVTLRPEYNEKIKLQLALAPLIYPNHSLSLGHLMLLLPGIPLSNAAVDNNIYNIFPRRPSITKVLQILCGNGSILQPLCINMVFSFVGSDVAQLNVSQISNFVTYFPSGTSVYVLHHTLQIFLTGKFSPCDYKNDTMNLEKYNKTRPDPYNTSFITHPVSLHYGTGDLLVPEEDVEIIERMLPNAIGRFKVPYEHFSHLDFMWGNNNRKLLFDRLVMIMDKYR